MLNIRALLVTLVLFGTVSTELSAQGPDEWEIIVAPYLMGASIGGTTTVRGREAEVDISASDVFSNLQFGAMGLVVARKGEWGVGGDAIWAALGATAERPPANVDFDQGLFAFYGLRRLNDLADLTAGLRVNVLRGQIGFKGPLQLQVNQDKTWVDPLVGLILHSPVDGRVRVQLYGEVGGFGVGSDIAWQIFPTVGIGVSERASIEVGYRWIDTDYKSGEGDEQFGWDMLMQGPVLGFALRF